MSRKAQDDVLPVPASGRQVDSDEKIEIWIKDF